jgi:acyl carrier protein
VTSDLASVTCVDAGKGQFQVPPGIKRISEGILAAVAIMGMEAPTEDPFLAEIINALQPFKKSDAPITAETDIARDLKLDSLAVMDLLMVLEDKFDVSIPLNMVAEITTVGQLAKAVRDEKAGA